MVTLLKIVAVAIFILWVAVIVRHLLKDDDGDDGDWPQGGVVA